MPKTLFSERLGKDTKYRQLGQKKEEPNMYYAGTWDGNEVMFDRRFRGHVFTDEECARLCRGETIEVHNLSGKYGRPYAVKGKLSHRHFGFPGYDGITYVAFESLDVVPNDPSFYALSEKHGEIVHTSDMHDTDDISDVSDDKDASEVSDTEDEGHISGRKPDMEPVSSRSSALFLNILNQKYKQPSVSEILQKDADISQSVPAVPDNNGLQSGKAEPEINSAETEVTSSDATQNDIPVEPVGSASESIPVNGVGNNVPNMGVSQEDKERLFLLLQKMLGLSSSDMSGMSDISAMHVPPSNAVASAKEPKTESVPATEVSTNDASSGSSVVEDVSNLLVKTVSDEDLSNISKEVAEAQAEEDVPAEAVSASVSDEILFGDQNDTEDIYETDDDSVRDPVDKANLEEEMDGEDFAAEREDSEAVQMDITTELVDRDAALVAPVTEEVEETPVYSSIEADDNGDDIDVSAEKALVNSDLVEVFGSIENIPPNILAKVAEDKGFDISLFSGNVIYGDMDIDEAVVRNRQILKEFEEKKKRDAQKANASANAVLNDSTQSADSINVSSESENADVHAGETISSVDEASIIPDISDASNISEISSQASVPEEQIPVDTDASASDIQDESEAANVSDVSDTSEAPNVSDEIPMQNEDVMPLAEDDVSEDETDDAMFDDVDVVDNSWMNEDFDDMSSDGETESNGQEYDMTPEELELENSQRNADFNQSMDNVANIEAALDLDRERREREKAEAGEY